MKLQVSALVERIRSSLFFVPMIAVFLAAGFGFATLSVDRSVDDTAALPISFTSTVESARTLLGVIAGATISFAGIAFSVSLLIIQLASSQYSPRVVHTLFRDPFNKRVMALVVGTFTYCVVVLRSVRSALDAGGEPVIPNLSVSLAVVLGVATILAIVAFINHSAHAMDVSEILDRIRRETTDQIRSEWTVADLTGGDPDAVQRGLRVSALPEPRAMIRIDRSGWVQEIDIDALLECLPEHTTARVETYAGHYAIEHTPFCTLWPSPDDAALEGVRRAVLGTVGIGQTRTMQQDVSYGLRQLADVAVKALSPGINDPTTAQDAIVHAAAVLSELLRHDPPPAVRSAGSRTVIMAQQPTCAELTRLAFEETRQCATTMPVVGAGLIGAIHSLVESLESIGLHTRTIELRRQARLIVSGCGGDAVALDDVDMVRMAFDERFGVL